MTEEMNPTIPAFNTAAGQRSFYMSRSEMLEHAP